MKKIMLFLIVTFLFSDCEELIKKFHAPNPETKTMKQLKRWVNLNVKDEKYKNKLLECLIANAADNPNKETIAAE